MLEWLLLFICIIIIALILVNTQPAITGGSELREDVIHYIEKEIDTPMYVDRYKTQKQKETKYLPPSSNKQIEQILKFGNPTDYYDLLLLLSKFARQSAESKRPHDYRRIVSQLIRNYKNDAELYRSLWKTTKASGTYNPNEVASYVNRNYKGVVHQSFKVDRIQDLFPKDKDIKYLDVGCGSGAKSMAFGEMIGLAPDQIHGTDVEDWGNFEKVDIKFKPITDGCLPYKDNEFHIISAFMTLHHVPDIPKMMAEIARVLKPNGVFLLREHNASDAIDKMLCDIEHLAYDFKENSDHDLSSSKNNMTYYNWTEWDVLAQQQGFKYIHATHDWSTHKETIGPTKVYHCFYRLPENN